MSLYTSTKIYPYVYMLTHKDTGQFYIGSRYTKNQKHPSHIDILKYQSSSRVIKALGFENFHVQIISEFINENTKYEDTWSFEQQLINEYYTNPLILNKHRFKDNTLKFMFRKQSEENKQRIREFWTGRPKSEAQKIKQSNNLKGKPLWSDADKKRISEQHLGRIRPKSTCPHCNKTGGVNMMKRWHFDNCKLKP